jgi:acetyl esterase/lipase
MVYNVSKPSLTVFEPTPGTSNGTAVVVCPGGGFHFLSMKNEGYDVARWLNERGITAFVLKYRLVHCLTDNPMMEFSSKGPNTEKFNKEIEPEVAMAIADGKKAISFVRTHADEYGVSTDKIGIMGFSAGGTVATGVTFTYSDENRPDFSAPVYPYVGSFGDPPVPEDAPPVFIVAASDDFFGFHLHCTELYEQWAEAGKSAELHIYSKGGHGFGMNQTGLPVDSWIERFHDWLLSLP